MHRLIAFFILLLLPVQAMAFCGFYVAKADGSLYNQSSKVVFVRDQGRSTITMSSDYRGPVSEFAMIVPTPKVLKRNDIRTVKAETVDHVDAYTAPRLVEYHDHDPCEPSIVYEMAVTSTDSGQIQRRRGAAALGVTIAAEYAVGNYDILILSAQQSDGLAVFLKGEGYKLPNGAEPALAGYIDLGMKFFVARVNLERHANSDKQELPPLQISFRSREFMLPIQLGKLNADKAQDALFFMLSRKGRVEVDNYTATPLPTNVNVPIFVEQRFGEFYRDMFRKTLGGGSGIVMEYAWDMAWCDPCAADPLSYDELQELGVSWAKPGENAAQDVYVTRFHAQYTRDTMMQDLAFRETNNRENMQGRYIMNQPFVGEMKCEAGKDYLRDIRLRLLKEAVELAEITGWSPRRIEEEIRKTVPNNYW